MKAGIAVSAAHVIFKLVGLVQVILVGRCLDSRSYDTVYAFAFEGVIMSLYLIGEEAISPAFLPVFMREYDTRDEGSAWAFANIVLTVQAILLMAVIVFIICFPGAVIRLCTAWDSGAGGEHYRLARESVVMLAPALLCLSLGSTTYVILNGYKKFFLAAMGNATWKVCVVISIVIGAGMLGLGYRAVIFGLLIGSIGKLLTHLVGLLGRIRLFRPSLALRSPALRTFALLMLPLLAGIAFAKVRDLFGNVYVLSTIRTEGLMKANSLGRKVPEAIVWLVPYALSIAMFPFLCELVDRNEKARLGRLVTQSCRLVLSVFIPFAVLCAVLAHPIAGLLFAGGKTPPGVTRWIGVSLACYVFILPTRAVEQVLIQAYFANRRTLAVTVMGMGFSTVTIVVGYIGIVVFGATGAAALAVVALGLVGGRVLKAIAFVWVMKRDISMFPTRETVVFLARMLVVSAGVGLSGFLGLRGFEALISSAGTAPVLLAKLCVAGLVGGGFFVALTRLLSVDEPGLMLRWTIDRLRERGGTAHA